MTQTKTIEQLKTELQAVEMTPGECLVTYLVDSEASITESEFDMLIALKTADDLYNFFTKHGIINKTNEVNQK